METKIRIFVIGDPHFKTNNVEECNLMCNEIIQLLDELRPDAVVCLGDVLDRHETIHVGPFLRSINFFEEIAKKYRLYILIGNHDRPSNQVFMTDEHPFTALKLWKNTTIVDRTIVDTICNQSFAFVPYVPPGRFMEALSGVEMQHIQAIFAHQEFYGAKMGATESLIGDKWNSAYPLVISGHIHDYDHLQSNIIYTGTPIQHAYGDQDNKGVFLFVFDGENKTWEKKMFALNIPKKKIVKIHCSEASYLKNLDPKSHYKIIISGTPEEIKSLKLGSMLSKIKRYKIVYKTISTIGSIQNPSDFENKHFLDLLADEIQSCAESEQDKSEMLENLSLIFGNLKSI